MTEQRTVAFFLEDKPLGICEVIALVDQESGTFNVRGSCEEAQKNNLRCKHCQAIALQFEEKGKIATEIDPSVPRSVISLAKADPIYYRELILHRGKVMWIP